jgi:cobalt-zinc-cadmium efflux system membrane fusion protein
MTVWVTADRRRFTKRTVKIGLQQNGWDQILEGLEPGTLSSPTESIRVTNYSRGPTVDHPRARRSPGSEVL